MYDAATHYQDALSERELEVLSLMAEGKTNQEIADALFLAVTTVKWYNTQIYEKLDVKNRKQAVARARAYNLLMSTAAPVDAINGPAVHLPRPSTPFIGRAAEVADVTDLLAEPTTRLMTILGPGGMGKTRLVLHIAHQQTVNYRDGVFFVLLAGVGPGEYMISAIVDAIRAPIEPEHDAKSALLSYLARLDMLLVLDNIEHLLADAPFIGEIVRHAPGVKVLVTSRERLNLSGETVYTLGGMAMPASTHDLDTDAAALFVQSTRRGRPDFDLQPDDHATLARILTLTQGMPLAIELAAGWMDMLTLPQIADELQQGMDILETELRDVPDRHRSVRATINASWERLTDAERIAFMRCSVFRASFDYPAAQAVAGANLRTLRKLVDKALLYALPGGRYMIHELLRQFGEEQLVKAGLADATQAAHTRYFIHLIASQKNPLLDMDQAAEQILSASYDDLIAAWEYLIGVQDLDLLADGIDASCIYFSKLGRNFDGYDLFRRALDMIKSRPTFQVDEQEQLLYGHFLARVVNIAHGISKEISLQMMQEAIDLLENLPDADAQLMQAYTQISKMISMGLFSQEERAEYSQKFVRLLDHLSEPSIVVQGLVWSGWLYLMEQRIPDVHANIERITQITAAHQIPRLFLLETYMLQAHLSGLLDDDQAFQTHMMNALEIAEYGVDLYALGHIRGDLAEWEGNRGNWQAAAQHMINYIKLHAEKGRDWQTLGALTGVVKHYYLRKGDDTMCVALMGFLQQYPQATRNARTEARVLLLNEVARDNLDEAAYQAALGRFQNYSLRQVIAAVIADLETV